MAISGSHSGRHCGSGRHSGPGHQLAPFWFGSSPNSGTLSGSGGICHIPLVYGLCKWPKPFLIKVMTFVSGLRSWLKRWWIYVVGGWAVLPVNNELLDVWLVWLASPSCWEDDVGSMVPSVTCVSCEDSRDLSYVWCEWLVPFVYKVSLVFFRVWLAWLACQQHWFVALARGALEFQIREIIILQESLVARWLDGYASFVAGILIIW